MVYAGPGARTPTGGGRAARRGIAPLPVEVPDAEAGKTIEVAARCWDALGGAALTRTAAVIAWAAVR